MVFLWHSAVNMSIDIGFIGIHIVIQSLHLHDVLQIDVYDMY